MDDAIDIMPVGSLAGKAVLSLQTGNKLGQLRDILIDPVSGHALGLSISGADGVEICLPHEAVYSFGHDAVMAISESSVVPLDSSDLSCYPRGVDLIGTKIITVSGNMIGQIRNVFVTVNPPPVVIFSFGESLLDRLLGREMFVSASPDYVLSDDRERLVVPDEAAENAAHSVQELLEPALSVRSFDVANRHQTIDDTFVIARDDEFETVLHADDDDTVIRLRTEWRPRRQLG